MKTIKVALYARVSHEEQKKYGFSIRNQIEKLVAYAEENNMQIVETYVDEGFSAATTKRPALKQLLSELHRFDIVIFTRLDRFSRNVLDANEMVKLFIKNDVSIKAIEEDDIDTSTADGMFMFNLKVSLAQRELAKGSERIQTVFDYKVNNGQAISGSQPFGYTIKKINGVKRVVKDQAIAYIVEDMFKYFFKYQSIRGLTHYMNEKYDINKSYNAYNRMLKNELYAGKLRGNLNYCEPYITLKEYEQIQGIIQKNIKITRTKHIYIFSGLLTCACCGNKMTGNAYSRKGVKPYVYYRCYKKTFSGLCDRTSNVSEKFIEDYLVKNIDNLIKKYICEVSVKQTKKPKKVNVKDILDEIDRLNYQFRKKRISEKEYDEEYELLETKLKKAELQAPQEIDISSVQTFLESGWQDAYHTLSKEDKRALFRSVIKNINVSGDKSLEVEFF